MSALPHFIPTVDLAAFQMGTAAERRAAAQQLYNACHQIGFVYLTNIGIDSELCDRTLAQMRQFFQLPLDVKQRYAWSTAERNQGYVGIARERLDPSQPGDLKEAFNVCITHAEAPSDGAQLWISELSLWEPTVRDFFWACSHTAMDVLVAIAISLDLPPNFLISRHQRYEHTLRFLHYPPLPTDLTANLTDGQSRAGAHSDYGSVTLLFQDRVDGLEVQTRSGEWIPAPPVADAVLMNLGDLLERWTNGIFRSTQHRVNRPTGDCVDQSRYSIAFFCHPDSDVEVACLPNYYSEDNPPRYPPIQAGEYLLSRLNATY